IAAQSADGEQPCAEHPARDRNPGQQSESDEQQCRTRTEHDERRERGHDPVLGSEGVDLHACKLAAVGPSYAVLSYLSGVFNLAITAPRGGGCMNPEFVRAVRVARLAFVALLTAQAPCGDGGTDPSKPSAMVAVSPDSQTTAAGVKMSQP